MLNQKSVLLGHANAHGTPVHTVCAGDQVAKEEVRNDKLLVTHYTLQKRIFPLIVNTYFFRAKTVFDKVLDLPIELLTACHLIVFCAYTV